MVLGESATYEGELTETEKDRLREWVAALRSGKFAQGSNYLKADNKYCCLGVACEISGLGRWNDDLTNQGYASSYVVDTPYPDYSKTVLPKQVREYFGLLSTDPEIAAVWRDVAGDRSHATYANDNGVSFEKIADGIEAFFELKEENGNQEKNTTD